MKLCRTRRQANQCKYYDDTYCTFGRSIGIKEDVKPRCSILDDRLCCIWTPKAKSVTARKKSGVDNN